MVAYDRNLGSGSVGQEEVVDIGLYVSHLLVICWIYCHLIQSVTSVKRSPNNNANTTAGNESIQGYEDLAKKLTW